MTNDPYTLDSFKQYSGSDSVRICDGTRLPITHVGQKILYTPTFKFILNDVLVDPDLQYNLVSVRCFSRDNSCSLNFDFLGFYVKEIPSQKAVHHCSSHGPLYPFLSDGCDASVSPPSAALVSKVSSSIWHRRLAHPGAPAMSKFIQRY